MKRLSLLSTCVWALSGFSALGQSPFCFSQPDNRIRGGLVADVNNYPAADQLIGRFQISGIGGGYLSINGGTDGGQTYVYDDFSVFSSTQYFATKSADSREDDLKEIFKRQIEVSLNLLSKVGIEFLKDGRNFGLSVNGGSYEGYLQIWPTGQKTAIDEEIDRSLSAYLESEGIIADCGPSQIAPMVFTSIGRGTELLFYPLSAERVMLVMTSTNAAGGNIMSFGTVLFARK